jgi:HlyD family secretion protein
MAETTLAGKVNGLWRRLWGNRLLLAAAGVVLLAAAGYLVYTRVLSRPAETAQLQTVPVQRTNILATVNASGTVAAPNQARLTFKTSGIVKEVYVKVGDVVKQGDPLAALDTTDLQAQVTQAEASLNIARFRLQQLLQLPKPEDIQSLQAAYDSALAKYEAARAALPTEDQLKAAQANYDAAVAKYQNLINPPTASQDLAALQAQYDAAVARLNQLLAGPNPNDVAAAKAQLDQAKAQLDQAQAAYNRVANRRDAADRPEAKALAQAQAAYQAALAAYQAKTAGPTEDQIKAAQAQVEQAKQALEAKKAQLADQSQIKAAEAAMIQAKQQLDQLQQALNEQANLKSAEAAVAQAKAQLDKALQGADPNDVAVAREQVRQAEASLQQARNNLDNAVLRAPFDGVVAAVNVNPGEQTSTAGGPIVVLTDLSSLRVDVNIDEADIGKVKVGQPARITSDNLPGQQFQGRVSAIAPTATIQQGVVNYQVQVQIQAQPGQPLPLRPGMTVLVSIIYDQRQNVLAVPNRAVRTQGRTRYVEVLVDGGRTERRDVQTGLSNDQLTEIVSGLKEGERVVIPGTTTAQPRVPTGFGGFGGGGFGGPPGGR